MVSINRIRRASLANEEQNNDATNKTSTVDSESRPSKPREKPGQECVVKRIIDEMNTKNGIRYTLPSTVV